MDLTSSGKLFVGVALIIIYKVVKEDLLFRDREGFLLLHSVRYDFKNTVFTVLSVLKLKLSYMSGQ